VNIYKLTRLDEVGWDEYEAAVVVAKSPQDARKIHPGGRLDSSSRDWAPPDRIEVHYLGKASNRLERGVYLSDFRRG
jgi:hypothetical protein